MKQFDIFLADLNPQIGTEPGKVRPVIIVQTNLLNSNSHPSTLIIPITSKTNPKAEILRVHLKKGTSNLNESCDIMIDQLRAIDNKRLIKKIGVLPVELAQKVKENMKIILDLD
ncbi:MAG: type II toxin-antitoxin system PemK/MazF family toxin [Flavobacterium sp.]